MLLSRCAYRAPRHYRGHLWFRMRVCMPGNKPSARTKLAGSGVTFYHCRRKRVETHPRMAPLFKPLASYPAPRPGVPTTTTHAAGRLVLAFVSPLEFHRSASAWASPTSSVIPMGVGFWLVPMSCGTWSAEKQRLFLPALWLARSLSLPLSPSLRLG